MKIVLIALILIAVSAMFLLATLRALKCVRAWVPFTSGVDARIELRREAQPAIFWLLTSAYACISLGAVAVLARFLLARHLS